MTPPKRAMLTPWVRLTAPLIGRGVVPFPVPVGAAAPGAVPAGGAQKAPLQPSAGKEGALGGAE